MQKPSPIQFGEYAGKVISYHAHRLSRSAGFRAAEKSDLEQDLWLDLIEAMPRFDSQKASVNTFIARVVENKCISLHRHRFAEKRHPGRIESSLNDHVKDCDHRTVERHQVTREASSMPQRLREMERDFSDVRASLTPMQRDIEQLLGAGTINSVAKQLKLSRRVVEREVNAMRIKYEDVGLRHYL